MSCVHVDKCRPRLHIAQDLDLAHPRREVIHAGTLFRQDDPLKRSMNVWKELWVVLFDHYCASARLLCLWWLARSRRQRVARRSGHGEAEGDQVRGAEERECPSPPFPMLPAVPFPVRVPLKPETRSHAVRQPIRVEYLALDSLTNRPVQRSNTLSRMIRNSTGRDSPDIIAFLSSFDASSSPSDSGGGSNSSGNFYPLSFHARGRHGGAHTLYAATLEDRNEWRRQLRAAIAARREERAAESVFAPLTITADTAASQDAPAALPGLVTGRIACSLPFGE